jgi:hypothetical protein
VKWIKLEYVDSYGRPGAHTANVKTSQDIRDILNRYKIQTEQVHSFQVEGKEHDLKQVIGE